jgi:small nuclear ribonucleoprotein (snRNP)-like protein
MASEHSPTALQILERHTGKKVRVILDRNFGFEGVVSTVSQNPAGIWLSDAEAVIIRTTLANPLPQVVSREDRSEIFINLSSVARIEVLH